MKTKTVRVTDIDIAYRTFGNGHPLILIMGYLGTMDMWDRYMLKELSLHNRVIIFDNRGMGKTTSSNRKFTIRLFADDTAGLLNALKIKRAHAFGWSMGTNIGLELALRYPDMVGRLILCAADCGAKRFIKPKIKIKVKQHLPKSTCNYSKENAQRQTMAIEDWKISDQRLGKIKQSTLLITGTKDTLIPAENSVMMAKRIPNAWLVQIKGAGHGVMYQYPKAFSRLILAFLKSN